MDAMDILGGLLGRKSSGGSIGGKILKNIILGGAKKRSQPAPQRRAPQPKQQMPTSNAPHQHGGVRLEDLLAEATGHHQQRRPVPQQAEKPPENEYRTFPRSQPKADPHPMNAQAEVLIRAMVLAAKADGQITRDEQESIVGQLGDLDQSEINFLQTEFAREVDVKDFAWSVPLGMEQQVYGISLMAMDLDEQKEAKYLGELAHGLRLGPEICNSIHDEFKAPRIFK
ncbi:MAG: DUF533 domain-containing protein [Planctomycetaceae bacterium]